MRYYNLLTLQYIKKFIYSTFIYQYDCLSQDKMGLTILQIRTMNTLTSAEQDCRESQTNVIVADTFGIIGMEQLSCLILQIKEQGIKSNQVSQSYMPEIIFTNWSRSVSHHFQRLLINTENCSNRICFSRYNELRRWIVSLEYHAS